MAKIDKLTPEQEALIPVYVEKWRRIALSTEPIDREKAAEAVKMAYAASGIKEPKILFCEGPDAADEKMDNSGDASRDFNMIDNKILWGNLVNNIWEKLKLFWKPEIHDRLWQELDLGMEIEKFLFMCGDVLDPETWGSWASYIDFCISVLQLNEFDLPQEWLVVRSLLESCGAVYPYQEIAFVCDRPRILSFDSDNRLHAEGKPALQFADGFTVYAYHGVELPEKYGKVHPDGSHSGY